MANKRAASARSKRLRVRVKYRTEPDLQRIGRAVIELALQQATNEPQPRASDDQSTQSPSRGAER